MGRPFGEEEVKRHAHRDRESVSSVAPGHWRDLATSRQRTILARLCDAWLASRGYETDTKSFPGGRGPIRLLRRAMDRASAELESSWGRLACSLRSTTRRHPAPSRLPKRLDPESSRPLEADAPFQTRFDHGQPAGWTARPHYPALLQRAASVPE